MKTRISRSELYDLVWSKAMWKLAPEFGLSGNGLAKLCRRNGIPVPDRGYWAKLQHGKRVRRPPLPPAKGSESDEIAIEPGPPRVATLEEGMPDLLVSMLTAERAATEPIRVPASPKPHPIVASWPKPQKPSYGVAAWTAEGEARRRRIASVLFCEIEKRGGIVRERDGKLEFVLLNVPIKVVLKERTTMVKIPPDPAKKYSYSHTEFRPTSILRLRFDEYFDMPVRREWNETEERRLEDRLRDIIIGWFIAVEAERRRHERLDRQHREWEAERLRRQEVAEQRRQEAAEIARLVSDVRDWKDAQSIKAYVEWMQANGKATETWSSWALHVAASLEVPARQRTTNGGFEDADWRFDSD